MTGLWEMRTFKLGTHQGLVSLNISVSMAWPVCACNEEIYAQHIKTM
jgi:demethoxyubiquinone hydroxylase (CLK1/Coq7/Cat5 family)